MTNQRRGFEVGILGAALAIAIFVGIGGGPAATRAEEEFFVTNPNSNSIWGVRNKWALQKIVWKVTVVTDLGLAMWCVCK